MDTKTTIKCMIFGPIARATWFEFVYRNLSTVILSSSSSSSLIKQNPIINVRYPKFLYATCQLIDFSHIK